MSRFISFLLAFLEVIARHGVLQLCFIIWMSRFISFLLAFLEVIARHGVLQLCFIIWSNRVFSDGYLIITNVSSFISLTPMTNIDSVNPTKPCLRAPPPYSFALPAPI